MRQCCPFHDGRTYGEDRYPSLLIWACTMYEHEGQGEFAMVFAGEHVHHSCKVFNRIVPESMRHLFFHEVGSQLMDHDLPMGFDYTIG